jgi:hypothetical protein
MKIRFCGSKSVRPTDRQTDRHRRTERSQLSSECFWVKSSLVKASLISHFLFFLRLLHSAFIVMMQPVWFLRKLTDRQTGTNTIHAVSIFTAVVRQRIVCARVRKRVCE